MITNTVTNKLLTRSTFSMLVDDLCSIRSIVKWDLVNMVFSQYFSKLLP